MNLNLENKQKIKGKIISILDYFLLKTNNKNLLNNEDLIKFAKDKYNINLDNSSIEPICNFLYELTNIRNTNMLAIKKENNKFYLDTKIDRNLLSSYLSKINIDNLEDSQYLLINVKYVLNYLLSEFENDFDNTIHGIRPYNQNSNKFYEDSLNYFSNLKKGSICDMGLFPDTYQYDFYQENNDTFYFYKLEKENDKYFVYLFNDGDELIKLDVRSLFTFKEDEEYDENLNIIPRPSIDVDYAFKFNYETDQSIEDYLKYNKLMSFSHELYNFSFIIDSDYYQEFMRNYYKHFSSVAKVDESFNEDTKKFNYTFRIHENLFEFINWYVTIPDNLLKHMRLISKAEHKTIKKFITKI